ncbi:MAG TPA: histidine kinase, partial [Burkholderiales bacterium]|nr:histidine kinase [Burkholderiales bacterium]
MRETVYVAQGINLALAKTALLSLRTELEDYLAVATRAGPQDQAVRNLATRLHDVLKDVTHDTAVVRIKLYSHDGVVVFSTDNSQIGQNQARNTGFISAVNGGVTTDLRYRGAAKHFDGTAQDIDRLETYVPVRYGATGPIEGVLEIYTDATPLVTRNQQAMFVILSGVGITLLLLYAMLIVIVRRARNVIEWQQRAIQQRAVTLEALSAQMLSSEEREKKKLAFGLHEGLGQTLSAIKLRLEDNLERIAAHNGAGASLSSIVPMLQQAIQDVQVIATELRPSSLDELGLLPTIDWFCREFERVHPEVRIEEDISIREEDTPPSLKIVIYRIIESAVRSIVRYDNPDEIRLGLRSFAHGIGLDIQDISSDSRYVPTIEHDADTEVQAAFAEARERTTLSGGTFSCSRNKEGRVVLNACWTV